jgi:alkanesulfonate monooxygenase
MSSAAEPLRGAVPRAAQSGLPDLKALAAFCRLAERCGIETVLTAFGFHRPDPIVLATALGMMTERITFLVAMRSGVVSPTAFVQQVNSVAAVTGGRIALNIVAGHTPDEQRGYGDFLAHNERYARTDEFLSVCRALWEAESPVSFEGRYYHVENARLNTPFVAREGKGPEIFLGGNSPQAADLAARHASCLLRLPEPPEKMKPLADALAQRGVDVGLLVSLLVRPTHDEAVAATESMLERVGSRPRKTHVAFRQKSDSVAFTSMLDLALAGDSPWLTPYLWIGAVPYLGAPAVAIVGSPEEVVDALWAYRESGVTQFLFMGWPDAEEMEGFARDVLPAVRAREEAVAAVRS